MHGLTPPKAHGDLRLSNIYIHSENGDVLIGSFCLTDQ